MSDSNCCFLTCIHISQEAGKGGLVFPSLEEFPSACDPHKDFGLVNKDIDFFQEFSCFFDDPMDVGNMISGSPAFSKSSLNVSVHILLTSGLENFELCFASM